MSVGDNLNKIMQLQDYNPTTLAKKAGVPQPRIYEIVSNITKNPRMETLQKLARALGISVDLLTRETGQNTAVLEPDENYGVPPEEKELVDLFRKLSEVRKQALLNMARVLGEVS